MGSDTSDVVGFFIISLLVFLSRFGRLGGGVWCVLERSPSEVGMETPSEDCVSSWSDGGVGSAGIMPSLFALVTRWCVRGAKSIYVGAVGVDEVWVVVVGVGVIFSALAPFFWLIVVRSLHVVLEKFIFLILSSVLHR